MASWCIVRIGDAGGRMRKRIAPAASLHGTSADLGYLPGLERLDFSS